MRRWQARPRSQPIVTPEAVVLDFERAGVASRSIAFLIDILALVLVVGIILLVVFQAAGDDIDGTAGALIALLTSLGTVVIWFCAFESLWRGRTLGKAAMGLRVVGVDGTSERFQQAFLRATVGLVDFFLIPIGFIAVVSALLSPRDQRLGDMAAGTFVVRERSAGAEVAPAWFRPPYGWDRYAGSLDVTAIDDDAYTVIRNFLLRVPQLTFGAREHLAVRIANPIAVRIGHTPPSNVHPHAFLECVAAQWQRKHVPNPYDVPQPGPTSTYGSPPPDWSTPTPPGGTYGAPAPVSPQPPLRPAPSFPPRPAAPPPPPAPPRPAAPPPPPVAAPPDHDPLRRPGQPVDPPAGGPSRHPRSSRWTCHPTPGRRRGNRFRPVELEAMVPDPEPIASGSARWNPLPRGLGVSGCRRPQVGGGVRRRGCETVGVPEPLCYLDHAATTPLRPEARAAMLPWLGERFGNPSGAHRVARAARQAVDEARDAVAEVTGCRPGDVIFTSGGTEADNLAIAGVHGARPGPVLCSAVDHEAVLGPVARLEGRTIPVDADGAGRPRRAGGPADARHDAGVGDGGEQRGGRGAAGGRGRRAGAPAGPRGRGPRRRRAGRGAGCRWPTGWPAPTWSA